MGGWLHWATTSTNRHQPGAFLEGKKSVHTKKIVEIFTNFLGGLRALEPDTTTLIGGGTILGVFHQLGLVEKCEVRMVVLVKKRAKISKNILYETHSLTKSSIKRSKSLLEEDFRLRVEIAVTRLRGILFFDSGCLASAGVLALGI